MSPNKSRMSSSVGWQTLVSLAAIASLFVLWLLLPLDDWLKSANGHVDALGNWAVLAAIVVYIVGVPLMVPGTALTLPVGLLFGLWKGFLIVIVGAPIGACISFLVGRYWARRWVEDKLTGYPIYRAIDRAVTQEGWRVVLLLRLSPLVPFNLQNYLFGVTSVAFRPYALASLIGMAPGTLLFVYIGAIGNAASVEQPSALKWTFFALGLIATAVVAMLLGRRARRAMQAEVSGEPGVETAR